jgi:hypothetical protein
MQTYRITLKSDDWFPNSDWLPLIAQIDDSLDIFNNLDDHDMVTESLEKYFLRRFFYDFGVNSPEIDFEYIEDGYPDLIVTQFGVYELSHEDTQTPS